MLFALMNAQNALECNDNNPFLAAIKIAKTEMRGIYTHAEAVDTLKMLSKLTGKKFRIFENGITNARIVDHYGKCVQLQYNGEWVNWFFPCSETEKKYYIFVPTLNVFMRNTSTN